MVSTYSEIPDLQHIDLLERSREFLDYFMTFRLVGTPTNLIVFLPFAWKCPNKPVVSSHLVVINILSN